MKNNIPTIWRNKGCKFDANDATCTHQIRISWMNTTCNNVSVISRFRSEIVDLEVKRLVSWGDLFAAFRSCNIIIRVSPVDLIRIRISLWICGVNLSYYISKSWLIECDREISLSPRTLKERRSRNKGRNIRGECTGWYSVRTVKCAKSSFKLGCFVVEVIC